VATTPEGRRLTEAHRRAQAANQQSFLAEFLAAYALLDVANLDYSTPNWLRTVMQLIDYFRQDSADLALRYARRFREVEVPDAKDPFPDIGFDRGNGPRVQFDLSRNATRVPRATRGRPRNRIPTVRFGEGARRVTVNWRDRDPAVEASLRVTGPNELKRRIKLGEPPAQAKRNAEAQSGGAALRHVADGGRDSLLTVVRNDRQALGWIRVTRPNCCAFCAMLASRGPVYNTEWRAGASNRRSERNPTDPRVPFSGDGRFKVHDNCNCYAEIVYADDTQWPGRGKEFQDLWNQYIRGRYGGKDAINAWRRLMERPDIFNPARRTRRRAA
jgi:hypothetical protein